jgi:hypothetical protein
MLTQAKPVTIVRVGRDPHMTVVTKRDPVPLIQHVVANAATSVMDLGGMVTACRTQAAGSSAPGIAFQERHPLLGVLSVTLDPLLRPGPQGGTSAHGHSDHDPDRDRDSNHDRDSDRDSDRDRDRDRDRDSDRDSDRDRDRDSDRDSDRDRDRDSDSDRDVLWSARDIMAIIRG